MSRTSTMMRERSVLGTAQGKSYTVIVRQPIGVRILWSKGTLKLSGDLATDIILTVMYGVKGLTDYQKTVLNTALDQSRNSRKS
jgi:hypothetical protein